MCAGKTQCVCECVCMCAPCPVKGSRKLSQLSPEDPRPGNLMKFYKMNEKAIRTSQLLCARKDPRQPPRTGKVQCVSECVRVRLLPRQRPLKAELTQP